MKKQREKWNGILYNGGFDDFSVNGSLHMGENILYKNNPTIESGKRLNMSYLLLTNPQMFELIQKSGGYFLHGTNANALFNILEYGLNSVDTSQEHNINVTTGEEWSRIGGKRKFISLTDSLQIALHYARKKPNNSELEENLFNFEVIVGTSLEDMNGINGASVDSNMPEVGIIGNLPLDHIKFLAVPESKVEFVKKMVGQKNIEVVSMNMRDDFFVQNFKTKLDMLENGEINKSKPEIEFLKEDVKEVVSTRRTSMIKKIFESLKKQIQKIKKIDESERN